MLPIKENKKATLSFLFESVPNFPKEKIWKQSNNQNRKVLFKEKIMTSETVFPNEKYEHEVEPYVIAKTLLFWVYQNRDSMWLNHNIHELTYCWFILGQSRTTWNPWRYRPTGSPRYARRKRNCRNSWPQGWQSKFIYLFYSSI